MALAIVSRVRQRLDPVAVLAHLCAMIAADEARVDSARLDLLRK